MATRLTPDRAIYRAKRVGVTVQCWDTETPEEIWLRASEVLEERLIEEGYAMLDTPTIQWMYEVNDDSGPVSAALHVWGAPITWPYELIAVLRNRIRQELEPVVVSNIMHIEQYEDVRLPVEAMSSRVLFYAGWVALIFACFFLGYVACKVAIGS